MIEGCIYRDHLRQNGCYNCCETCNYDRHVCPACGDPLRHDGREHDTGDYHFPKEIVDECKEGKVVSFIM